MTAEHSVMATVAKKIVAKLEPDDPVAAFWLLARASDALAGPAGDPCPTEDLDPEQRQRLFAYIVIARDTTTGKYPLVAEKFNEWAIELDDAAMAARQVNDEIEMLETIVGMT